MRFVVVQIEDNDEADAFVQAVKNGLVFYGQAEAVDGGEEIRYSQAITNWEVPQMYAVPTKLCECKGVLPGANLGRTARYGWVVCRTCSKPRASTVQHPTNLVHPTASLSEKVYYMGFRSDRMPWREAWRK